MWCILPSKMLTLNTALRKSECIGPGLKNREGSQVSANGLLTWRCFCSIGKSCLSLCHPMDCSTPGFPVLHHLPELAQTHVRRVSDAIQPSHPLPPTSPPALNLSQHQVLFQQVSSSYQEAKVLEFQLQHQSFQ